MLKGLSLLHTHTPRSYSFKSSLDNIQMDHHYFLILSFMHFFNIFLSCPLSFSYPYICFLQLDLNIVQTHYVLCNLFNNPYYSVVHTYGVNCRSERHVYPVGFTLSLSFLPEYMFPAVGFEHSTHIWVQLSVRTANVLSWFCGTILLTVPGKRK